MKAHVFSFLLLLVSFAASPSPASSVPLKLTRGALEIPTSLDGFVAGVWSQFSVLLNAGEGDVRDAIIPLKRYFAQFGYLNVTGNATDVFDTDLVNAVKLYQESFGLDVSGKLDLKTLLKIMTPRCGREDVADGIPLMLQSTPAAMNSHIVGHYSFFPSQPKWPSSQSNLTYAFSSLNETDRLSSAERRSIFASAFNAWAAVIPINFTEIDSFDDADITIEFVSFTHGDDEPFDGILGVLAHAFSPTDGRFHLDESEYWQDLSSKSSLEIQDIDLQSVVVHEIGHLLGLAHTPVEDAIMYPSIAPGQVKLQLQADDIQGAQALYGANPNYKADSTAPGIVGDINGAQKWVFSSSHGLLGCVILLCVAMLT
ncbi:hypothetical protein L7F22_056846 [Adiantum nelumboides]|nr:hypothetical protein [Adiantum nelumboides]